MREYPNQQYQYQERMKSIVLAKVCTIGRKVKPHDREKTDIRSSNTQIKD